MNIRASNTANFAMPGEFYQPSKAVRRRSQGDTDAATVHDAEALLESLRGDEERKGNE